MKLIRPNKLQTGDFVATVSLSWGGAGNSDLLWRYEQGKQRLEEILQKAKAILFGEPYQGKYYDEYKEVIKTIEDENNNKLGGQYV